MATVELLNKAFVSRNYKDTDYDLISVRLDDDYTGKGNLAVNINSAVKHIGLLKVDCTIGDGVHFGAAFHDAVIDELDIYCHDLAATPQHWDCIQVLAGANVLVRSGRVLQRNEAADVEGRCVFMRAGTVASDLQNWVFEHVSFEAHTEPISTKTQVVTVSQSLRSGLRYCTVTGPRETKQGPLWFKSDAQHHVDLDNRIVIA